MHQGISLAAGLVNQEKPDFWRLSFKDIENGIEAGHKSFALKV